MFTLSSTLQIGITLENAGQELAIGSGQIRSLSLIENKHDSLPSCELTFEDITDTVAQAAMGDGALLNVLLGADDQNNQAKQYTFRVFTSPGITNATTGKALTLSGVADKMSYLRNVNDKPYAKMNSHEVISAVASDNGLMSDVDSTNDSMTWLPINKPFSHFVRHVADYGYRSAMSHMQTAVTDVGDGNWTLRYKDISQLLGSPSPKANLVSLGLSAGASDIPVLMHTIQDFSGFMNSIYGYSGQTAQQQIEGTYDINQLVNAVLGAGALQMNSIVKGQIPLSFRSFIPLETGNTHDKWAVAYNQNKRLAATHTGTIELMVPTFTTFGLLDVVGVQLANLNGDQPDQTYSGNYVVTGRVRHVQGNSYREKITLSVQGVNQDSTGNRVTAGDNSTFTMNF